MDGTVQTFHLTIAVGSVWSTSHVFDVEGNAQRLKLTFELRSVVRPYFCRVTKNLKNLFFYGIRYCFAAFVLYQSQHAKFAETAYCTQNVHFGTAITKINYEVKRPFTTWTRGEW